MEEKVKLKIGENDLTKGDKEDLKDIPIEPFKANCDYCAKPVITCAKREYNLALFPYALFILYFYGIFYGIIIFLMTFLLFQNIVHVCPECFSEIASKNFYPIKQKGDYYSLTFGKCSTVVKKLYIHILLLILLLFGIYINYKYYTLIKVRNK